MAKLQSKVRPAKGTAKKLLNRLLGNRPKKKISKATKAAKQAVIGNGFWAKSQFYLTRCYDCGLENHAGAVAIGQCAWCGSTKSDKDVQHD